MLKIKADALVLVCQHEQAKHQMNDHEILQEVEEPVREEEQLQPSPIEASSEISEARQSKQKLAYILTAMIFLAIAIFGGFSYLNTQNKYAGLKTKHSISSPQMKRKIQKSYSALKFLLMRAVNTQSCFLRQS